MNRNDHEFDKTGWVAQARALLDESSDGLDASTLSRLNRARQTALAQRGRPAAQRWWLPAGVAGACAMLLAVAVWLPRHGAAPADPSHAATMSNLDAQAGDTGDATEDTPEFYQDLDFYAWLDAQGQDGPG